MAPTVDPTKIEDVGTFLKHYPSFIWGPTLLASAVYYGCQIPQVAAHFERMGSMPFGMQATVIYTVYAILLSFAAHGWYCTFVDQPRQLQAYESKGVKLAPGEDRMRYVDKPQPRAAAIRSTLAMMTGLVYSVFPFAPATTSWAAFAAWTAGLAVYWDFHFFIVHSIAHENRHAYKWLHKLHHIYKQPDVFTAYFVTYQSHFFTEQLVILLACAAGLPVDVFIWTIGFGTLDTFIKHAGHDIASYPLPLLPITWEQLATMLSPWGLLLGGETTAMHDWHHEKFNKNYALSFKYLDRLFGTYHPGRVAGEAVKPIAEPPIAKPPPVVEPTPPQTEGLVKEEAKEEVVKADGDVVANVLRMVEVMKGELGEIGARVDMYEHSLQTATRARRAGADTETIVCALLQDIKESTNHEWIASSLLRPYITPQNQFLLSSHEVFQAAFLLDKLGDDQELRDKVNEYTAQGYVKGHPFYDATEKFCIEYDQPSFDPSYNSDSLDSFVPLVKEVFAREPFWWGPKGKPVDGC